MINTDKKQWSTPKLRVFVRTRAEENVLAGCKYFSGTRTGAMNANIFCLASISLNRFEACKACGAIAFS